MKQPFALYEDCLPYVGNKYYHTEWETLVRVTDMRGFESDGWMVLVVDAKYPSMSTYANIEKLLEVNEMLEVLYD